MGDRGYFVITIGPVKYISGRCSVCKSGIVVPLEAGATCPMCNSLCIEDGSGYAESKKGDVPGGLRGLFYRAVEWYKKYILLRT